MILCTITVCTSTAFIELACTIYITLMIVTGSSLVDTGIRTWTPVLIIKTSFACEYITLAHHINLFVHGCNTECIGNSTITRSHRKSWDSCASIRIGARNRRWTHRARLGTWRYWVFHPSNTRYIGDIFSCYIGCLHRDIDNHWSDDFMRVDIYMMSSDGTCYLECTGGGIVVDLTHNDTVPVSEWVCRNKSWETSKKNTEFFHKRKVMRMKEVKRMNEWA